MPWPGKIIQEQNGQLYDNWGQPFEYSIQGDGYLLLSLGRDGKPGGEGLDFDWTNRNVDQTGIVEARLTLPQFLEGAVGRNIFYACLCCGALTSLGVALLGREFAKNGGQSRGQNRSQLLAFLVATGVLVAFTLFTTSLICVLDLVPSSH